MTRAEAMSDPRYRDKMAQEPSNATGSIVVGYAVLAMYTWPLLLIVAIVGWLR